MTVYEYEKIIMDCQSHIETIKKSCTHEENEIIVHKYGSFAIPSRTCKKCGVGLICKTEEEREEMLAVQTKLIKGDFNG